MEEGLALVETTEVNKANLVELDSDKNDECSIFAFYILFFSFPFGNKNESRRRMKNKVDPNSKREAKRDSNIHISKKERSKKKKRGRKVECETLGTFEVRV